MTLSINDPLHLDIGFDEALARIAQTNPDEVEAQSDPRSELGIDSVEALIDQFENAGQNANGGEKFWYGRELALLLGYDKWERFEGVITRAKHACAHFGQSIEDNFQEVFPAAGKNPEGGRPSRNYRLSRYAAYLVAQNADARKKPVAFAQTYFAIQTRRQELNDRDGVNFDELSENQKRLYLRNQVVAENNRLARAAQAVGVEGPDFGRFHNRGYQGLYGGRGTKEIRIHKRLHATAQILDHMGSTELAANLFRITQTEEKLRSGAVVGKEAACEAHYEVGRKVRQTIKELSGIMPENLPVADDVKKIAARERKLQRVRAIPPARRIAEPLASPKPTDPVEIDLRRDLWKYALLIMSVEPGGEISTSALIERVPEYIRLSDDHMAANASRKDSKFSQIVRNLKSHKATKNNFIFQGYAEDVRGGFKITAKGIAFVREYFST